MTLKTAFKKQYGKELHIITKSDGQIDYFYEEELHGGEKRLQSTVGGYAKFIDGYLACLKDQEIIDQAKAS